MVGNTISPKFLEKIGVPAQAGEGGAIEPVWAPQ